MRIEKKPPIKASNQSILVKNDRIHKFYAPHHYHQDYEIIHIKKSRGIRIIGNNIDNYSEGEIVILGPGLPHYHEVSTTNNNDEYPIETIAVLFPESIFEQNLQYPEFSQLSSILEAIKYGIELKGDTRNAVQQIMESMTLSPSYHNFASLFRILEIVSEKDSLYQRLSTVKFENKRLYNEKTKHILDYIAENSSENITVKLMAEQSKMSVSGFCVFFKSQTGYTFSKYVNRLRINRASELLATTSKSISEIAFEVGYENLAYFNRQFKEIKERTPREFRIKLTQ